MSSVITGDTSDIPMTRDVRQWDRTRVLMYHRVVNQPDCRCPWTVKASLFRGHLELLQRHGYSTITLCEYVAALENGLALPAKPVILTFDDGYVDFAEVVVPILQEYGMKAVVFAVADSPTHTNYWSDGGREETARLMENHHLQRVRQAGCEVGSHTLSHRPLPELCDAEKWREVSESRTRLEEIVGAPVVSFSYPFGLLDETTKQLVIKAGYKSACAAWTGPVAFTKDRYEIRRILVSHDLTPAGLWGRLAFPYQEYRWAVWKTKCLLKRSTRWVRKNFFGDINAVSPPRRLGSPLDHRRAF
jgi:peptidoglycan/xylan/chitin deacetylase (PgdA/CDA1 family)